MASDLKEIILNMGEGKVWLLAPSFCFHQERHAGEILKVFLPLSKNVLSQGQHLPAPTEMVDGFPELL